MPQSTATHGPRAHPQPRLFYVEPSTALSGASVVVAPDWSVFLANDEDDAPQWTEEEIVFLHWRLLREVRNLADPDTPLHEKLETLRWVFTEPHKDDRPFSFANCLRVVGCSPLSPIPYCGAVDQDEIRERIARKACSSLQATLARYPTWVRETFEHNPEWIEAQLNRNPQWLNEQVKQIAEQGDLFA